MNTAAHFQSVSVDDYLSDERSVGRKHAPVEGREAVIPLPEIDCQALAELYLQVEFPPQPTDGEDDDKAF